MVYKTQIFNYYYYVDFYFLWKVKNITQIFLLPENILQYMLLTIAHVNSAKIQIKSNIF